MFSLGCCVLFCVVVFGWWFVTTLVGLGFCFGFGWCFIGCLVVFWVSCDHIYVGVMLGLVGWSCEGMLEALRASHVGCFCAGRYAPRFVVNSRRRI